MPSESKRCPLGAPGCEIEGRSVACTLAGVPVADTATAKLATMVRAPPALTISPPGLTRR